MCLCDKNKWLSVKQYYKCISRYIHQSCHFQIYVIQNIPEFCHISSSFQLIYVSKIYLRKKHRHLHTDEHT